MVTQWRICYFQLYMSQICMVHQVTWQTLFHNSSFSSLLFLREYMFLLLWFYILILFSTSFNLCEPFLAQLKGSKIIMVLNSLPPLLFWVNSKSIFSGPHGSATLLSKPKFSINCCQVILIGRHMHYPFWTTPKTPKIQIQVYSNCIQSHIYGELIPPYYHLKCEAFDVAPLIKN